MCSHPLTINDRQKWTRPNDAPISRGHCGHGVSNKRVKGFSKVTLSDFAVDVSPPCQLAGLRAPSFSRIQIGSRYLPLSHSRVRGFSPHASGSYSMQRQCSSTVAAQSIRDKPKYQVVVSVTVHHRVLSNALVLAGPQPSEASNGRVPKLTRAFHEKEGELPNVGC